MAEGFPDPLVPEGTPVDPLTPPLEGDAHRPGLLRAVWKYPLELVDGPQEREMPKGARVVHVATQDVVTPTLWAEVSVPTDAIGDVVSAALVWTARRFVVHGTGHVIDHDGTYVGTCHTHHGAMVWHIYELERP